MNAELLHMAMLVVFGNDYLLNNKSHTQKNSPYIGKVRFVKTDKNESFGFLQKLFSKYKDSNIQVAESEQQWYKYLKKKNCQAIKLVLEEEVKSNDHVVSAFANGVPGWMINCIFDGYSEFWLRSWESDSSGGETKWNINYYGCQRDLYREERCPQDLGALKEKLDDILKQIGDFSVTIGFSEWKVFFDKGREALNTEPEPSADIPDSYSKEAVQLLSAVKSAWVFGGMGSWNDSAPYYAHQMGKEEDYNKLTSALYSALLESVEASVNSLTVGKQKA